MPIAAVELKPVPGPRTNGVDLASAAKPLAHLFALDGLRGIAVLLVLWVHTPEALQPGLVAFLRFAAQPGYLGVDIFFALSGFLITRILIRDKARGAPLAQFFIRRFLRIFPIFYLLLVVLLVADPAWYLFWSATYLSNFAFAIDLRPNPLRHTWSLSVEEHFYAIWPFAVYWTANPRRVLLTCGIPVAILSAVVLHAVWGKFPGDELILRGTFSRLLSLSLGGLLAFHEPWLTTDRRGGYLGAGLFVPAVLFAPAAHVIIPAWIALGKLVGFALLSTSLVMMAAFWTPRFLTQAWLRFVGRISYGLYLYHYPVFYFLGLIDPAEDAPVSGLRYAAAVVLAFVISIASFYLIEAPILRLKERFP